MREEEGGAAGEKEEGREEEERKKGRERERVRNEKLPSIVWRHLLGGHQPYQIFKIMRLHGITNTNICLKEV